VLWIGFLQWHLKSHGNLQNLPEPIIKDLHNIENRDAVLEYDERKEQRDAEGKVVTRWDGRTTKPHPVTGEEVPDPEALVPVYTYANPRPTQWPAVDYIVGNPPFIGDKAMRLALGDEYTQALRKAYANVPDSADFVMFWWDKAAELVRIGSVKRFGFITTNSLKQTFNRKVLQHHMGQKQPVALAFAIPDHPWVDSADGAAVRVAMTVGVPGNGHGVLHRVVKEVASTSDEVVEVALVQQVGKVYADLTIGADVAGTVALNASAGLHSNGMMLAGSGFILTHAQALALGFGTDEGIDQVIKPYRNGRDVTQVAREAYVIDLFEFTPEQVARQFPRVYQYVLDHVKPERDLNRRDRLRLRWWQFAEGRSGLRKAMQGLKRYIATAETAKHRFFVFLDASIVPDHMLIAFANEEAFVLGVLSSQIHIAWALAAGGTLEDRPRYNKSRCLDPFPFPVCTPNQQAKIRDLAEQLDAHRKRQQALHPTLTLTGMYNVLEAVRSGQPLSDKDRKVYEDGLVGILKELHDQLDAAVADAYGWPADLSTDEILHRLVELNAERAAEEARGLVRWLRPEYQAKGETAPQGTQAELEVDEEAPAPAPAALQAWPKQLPAQAAALTTMLATLAAPATVAEIAARFEGKANKKRLEEIGRLLETLEALGRARFEDGKWGGV
jgi:hypothetical protein